MIRVAAVAIIIENAQNEILLLLRDNKPTISYPNHWSLVGGKIEDGETPEIAAHREMLEEIGTDVNITFWKRYDRQHSKVIVDQHIYIGEVDTPRELLTLGEGQDFRFFHSDEIRNIKIAFEFEPLLHEFFLSRKTK